MIESFPFLSPNEQNMLLTSSNGLLTLVTAGPRPHPAVYASFDARDNPHTNRVVPDHHVPHVPPPLPPDSTSPSNRPRHAQTVPHILLDRHIFQQGQSIDVQARRRRHPAAKTQVVDSILDHLKTEIEPFLARHLSPTFLTSTDADDATPNPPPPPSYFLSSPRPTLAEIHIIPFSMRLLEFSNGTILPLTLRERIQSETPVFYAWSNRSMANPNIWEYWGDSAYWIARIEERLPKAQAKYADA